MYTSNDRAVTGKILCKWVIVLTCISLAFAAAIIAGMALRSIALAIAASVAGTWAFLFVYFLFVHPMHRYRRFLKNLETGLKRDAEGVVVSISPDTEEQDGATVHVMILLVAEDDERRLYLNASKREFFPAPGDRILAHCCGRHVLEITGQ